MVKLTCNPHTPDEEAGGSGVQEHPQLHSMYKASFHDMTPNFKKTESKIKTSEIVRNKFKCKINTIT